MTTRRAFIGQVVWASLGAQLVLPLGACRRREDPTRPARPDGRFFTAAELAVLAAACERILPRDRDPGAIDLGVPAYIDGAFARAEFQARDHDFRRGLRELDAQATHRFGVAFASARPEQQDGVLSAFQIAGSDPQVHFFADLFHLTLEGAFGDPRWGGNRDRAGWALLGFAPDACGPAGLARLRKRGA